MFDWTDFITLAESLLDPIPTSTNGSQPSDEARYRASASRAYYAAFQTLVDYLEDFDSGYEPEKKPKDIGLHEYTINRLKKINDSKVGSAKLCSIAEKLYRAKGERHHADYKKDKTLEKGNAEHAISNSKESIKWLLSDRDHRTNKKP